MLRARRWRREVVVNSVRTFEVEDCVMDLLVQAKAGRTISVCIPCRDEAATIGPLVSMVRHYLMRRKGLGVFRYSWCPNF